MEKVKCHQCNNTFEQFSDQRIGKYFCSKQCSDDYQFILESSIDNENNVICPYCKTEYQDSWDYFKNDEDDYVCDECGRKFDISIDYSVTYSSKPHLDELKKIEKEKEQNGKTNV